MNRNRWSGLVVAMSLTLALGAVAQERGGQANQSFIQRFGQRLNLTDVQKKQIDEMDGKFRKENEAFFDKVQQTMTEYRAARQANDTAKMEALRPKVEAERAEMMKVRGPHEEKIEALLNDTQKAQWKKIKSEREARMMHPHEPAHQ